MYEDTAVHRDETYSCDEGMTNDAHLRILGSSTATQMPSVLARATRTDRGNETPRLGVELAEEGR